jgi:hypothetical protein
MPWVQMDPGFTRHPKVLQRSPAANWLWLEAIDYSVSYLTDGTLSDAQLTSLPTYSRKSRDELVASGSLEQGPRDLWILHDFLVYQRRSDRVKAEKDAHRARSRAYYERRRAQRLNGGQSDARSDASDLPSSDARSDASSDAYALPLCTDSDLNLRQKNQEVDSPHARVGEAGQPPPASPSGGAPPAAAGPPFPGAEPSQEELARHAARKAELLRQIAHLEPRTP